MAVYFARLEQKPSRIKIGYSSNVWYRLQGLCNQFRQDVTVLAIVPGDTRREYVLQERLYQGASLQTDVPRICEP